MRDAGNAWNWRDASSPQRRRDAEISAEKNQASEDLRIPEGVGWRHVWQDLAASFELVLVFSALISASLRLCGEWTSAFAGALP
jgi:hypothetical protein